MLDTITGRKLFMNKVTAAKVIQKFYRARLLQRVEDGLSLLFQKKLTFDEAPV